MCNANVYLLCRDGNALMPATFQRIDDETGLAVVTSPTGIEYTANPGHLVSQEDAADMLRDRRADKLVTLGYVILHLRADRYRVFHPGKHGIDGGYILTLGDHPTCTCPDFHKRAGKPCKHIKAAPDLLRYALVQKPTIRVAASVRLVVRETAEERHARFAAMVDRDFGPNYTGDYGTLAAA